MNFYEVITQAIRDFEKNGFDSQKRLEEWTKKIKEAAQKHMVSEKTMHANLVRSLKEIFSNQIIRGGVLRAQPISKFTLNQIKPSLRRELDRRIMSSASLIRLNREAMIQKTIQRFSGWATSIPKGGSAAIDKVDVKSDIGKALKSLPFEERRVMIDQGHKFVSSLNNIIAMDSNAIAAVWHSNYRQRGYDYREDHKERDGKIYVIRDNWALQKGFMKLAGREYSDKITQPAEEVYCRCSWEYLYALRDLPEEMLTQAGKEALEKARKATI